MQAVPRSRPCGRTSGKPSAERLRALPPGKVKAAKGDHGKLVVKEQETSMQAGQETGIRAGQKFRERAKVLQNTRIAGGIYDLRLKTEQTAAPA